MAKYIPAPGFTCPHCGYSSPNTIHLGCGGTILIDTETGKEVCSICGAVMTGTPECRKCGKPII